MMLYSTVKFDQLLLELDNSTSANDEHFFQWRLVRWQIQALKIQAEEIERLRLEQKDIYSALTEIALAIRRED